ncbi:MAG: NAD-glutamate dehydrogenase, partial [Halomonadaceae bacterium]
SAFPAGYRDQFSPRRAAIDVDYLERASQQTELAMSFYREPGESGDMLHFKIFHPHQQLTLSDIIPIFENLGFRVIGENPFETLNRDGQRVWIHDFSLRAGQGQGVDIQRIRPLFESLFQRIWSGEAENDIFNRLMLAAYLDWRQIAVLRAYGRYMRQIRISNSQYFIASTLVSHVSLAALLLEFFDARFNPARYQSELQWQAVQQKLEIEFNAGLDQVLNLSEDRVLRLFLSLMQASTRTNYYQLDEQGRAKSFISFKLRPGLIHEMPKPRPMFEIFVYSPLVEGVHLRGGKVARGGLRWSDRYEDYRTEVLGLVKAQQVKNAVIVPVGAKGGFVAKQLPEQGSREELQKAGIAAYSTFIRGLLDITDNYPGGIIVPPKDVLRHDEDDYYLVVAADKGTATFSDIANGIAQEYGFWLGDAFASGGSQGYDHKKMGITARGAWVAVERHFREMGLNTATDDFTVVGIGDMGGDVFGNGMLCSEHIRLQAAFNHVHIFIDPDPDPQISYQERLRLFKGPASSWEDYNPKLISPGGGVFSRNAKSIVLSHEMKRFLGTDSDSMPPNMLISQILRVQVDLLWIGGIGTFVKSSQESHSDVGDKANDSLRVDALELGCRVIGEGGNLGMSQRARIEYSLQGGRCNTDFIDNAGGVDCSDHEVNIKILLNRSVEEGDLTLKQRNQMLVAMTDDVSRLVLRNMYRQTQAISIASREAASRLEEYRRLMSRYEAAGILDRQLEFLPEDDALNDRQLAGQGLTRPELSILASYVKADLKQILNASSLPDDPSLGPVLQRVFPASLVKRFGSQLAEHQLHREIIATEIANDMVNSMGITFVERLQQSTGASVAAIAQSYLIASAVFDLPQWWYQVEALDYAIDSELQMTLMADLMRLIRRGTHWLLRNRRSEMNIQEHQNYFASHVRAIAANLPGHLGKAAEAQWRAAYESLAAQGVPEQLAGIVAASGHLYAALGIIEAREETGRELQEVTQMFYAMGEELDLDWLALAISHLKPRSHWQAMARESFREDLSWQQRALTTAVLGRQQNGESIAHCLALWQQQHQGLVDRWHSMLAELRAQPEPEFPMFSVALRELLDLAQSTQHVGLAGH